MRAQRRWLALLLLATAMVLTMNAGNAQDSFDAQRRALVDAVRETSARAAPEGAPPIGENTLSVIGRVPRHEFVPAEQRALAYLNRPLPIGGGQTISQPYIVALMTELADVQGDETVLEIGTGSGYQAAVLAELARHVYTIEIVDWLGERAAADLERLGYDNVSVRVGDGYAGWPEHAPFGAIVVTAAPETIPAPLVEQLAVGGRLVIPVGTQRGVQMLRVVTKRADGELSDDKVIPVRFVPFTRD